MVRTRLRVGLSTRAGIMVRVMVRVGVKSPLKVTAGMRVVAGVGMKAARVTVMVTVKAGEKVPSRGPGAGAAESRKATRHPAPAAS